MYEDDFLEEAQAALESESWQLRFNALGVFKHFGVSEYALGCVVRLLVDPSYAVRAEAARVLGRYGDLDHVVALEESMKLVDIHDPYGSAAAAQEAESAILEIEERYQALHRRRVANN